jgi:hypothetical protein
VKEIKKLELKKCAKNKIESFDYRRREHAICGFKKVMLDHGQSVAKKSKFAVPPQ